MVNCLFSCWAFAQEDIYIAPQEQIEWAKQFSGVSGPGMPVEGDGRGGWRSGTEGVVWQSSPSGISGRKSPDVYGFSCGKRIGTSH